MSTPSIRITGALVPHVRGFHDELIALGYQPAPAVFQLRLMAHVSRWLEARGLVPGNFTVERIEQFLRGRRRAGYAGWRTARGLAPLLAYLRRGGVVPHPPVVARTAVERLVDTYCDHLCGERGLMARTIEHYQRGAVRFLEEMFPSDKPEPARLTAGQVSQFVVSDCRGKSITHAKLVVSTLRSLLRFLYLRGWTPRPLTAAVPAVASWRLSSLPRPVEQRYVALLLRSCDRSTAAGQRSYAIILLLARFGLRAGEVAALTLDDVDWVAGTILVRGKSRQEEKLPLPADVGTALVAYLRRGRPRASSRALFLRRFAPIGPISRSVVTHLVRMACVRAGIPGFGAHRLRHTAATQMLRRGAPLSLIAQALRHRSTQSTAIYAKVDRDALRAVAQRWPGGAA